MYCKPVIQQLQTYLYLKKR